MVNSDEGLKPTWTTEAEDHVLMRYTLMEAANVAEPRGVLIGLEPHQQYSKHPDGLDRIYRLVKSPAIGINFDTGNSYLCGHDPYKWLARVVGRLVHLGARDQALPQGEARHRALSRVRHRRASWSFHRASQETALNSHA